MTANNDFYAITYGHDEIGIRVAVCRNPGLCTCQTDESSAPKCGYSAKQAKQYIVQYYKRRDEQVEALSIDEFLHDSGYYT